MNKTVKYLAIILLISAFLTAPVTVPLFKSSTSYSIFNTGWDGASKFARLAHDEGKNILPVFEPFDTAKIGKMHGVLLIIGPNVSFTRSEVNELREFLGRGNTVLIADDFGTGNELLRALNVSVRISRHPLGDFFYLKDDRLIVSVRINDPILARNVSRIVTNEPAGITLTRAGEVYPSRVAMVDMHRGTYPIMAEIRYGRGRIVVLSDPDVLTNMQFQENEAFLKNLIDYLGGETFYFDEAHHPDFSLYTAGTVTVTRIVPRDWILRLVMVAGVFVLLVELGVFTPVGKVVSRLLSRFLEEKADVEELALSLARERGWDEGEVLKMLRKMGG